MGPERIDIATVIALGVLAGVCSLLFHETLGHALTCGLTGGRVVLLTAILFRCLPGSGLTDLAGPGGNALAAACTYGLWCVTDCRRRRLRFFLVLLLAINLLWLAGQTVYSGVRDKEDLAFAAQAFHWPTLWRTVAVLGGLALYVGGIRLTARMLAQVIAAPAARARAVRFAYLASLVTGVLMSLLWREDLWDSARDTVLALGVAPLGLLFSLAHASRQLHSDDAALGIQRSRGWQFVALLTLVIFALTQARGLPFR